jgi:hypothetical protein
MTTACYDNATGANQTFGNVIVLAPKVPLAWTYPL